MAQNITLKQVLQYISEAYDKANVDTLSLLHTLTDTENLVEATDIEYPDPNANKYITLCLLSRNTYISKVATEEYQNKAEHKVTKEEEDIIDLDLPEPTAEVVEKAVPIYSGDNVRKVNHIPLENIISNNNVKQDINKVLDTTDNSYERGRLGEDELVNIIQQSRPDFTVTKVSTTGHVGDIHVDDDINNIKYVVESKLKQKITKMDLTKFLTDVDEITKSCPTKYVYGIFVSLNSNNITTIGTTKCDAKTVYLTAPMVSKDVFKLIFEMVPIYINTMKEIANAKSKSTVQQPNGETHEIQEVHTTVEYVIPDGVRHLVATLQQLNNDVHDEEESLATITTNAQTITCEAAKLKTKLIVKRNYILDLNYEFNKSGIHEFTAVSMIGGNTPASLENDEQFLKYIRETPKSKITKKQLKTMFPQHITEISSMNMDEIFEKYKPTTTKVKKTTSKDKKITNTAEKKGKKDKKEEKEEKSEKSEKDDEE